MSRLRTSVPIGAAPIYLGVSILRAIGSRQTDYRAAYFSYGDIINFPAISNVGIIAGKFES